VVMPARPLNVAERHLTPKTPLHRNDSAIESQSLDLPATPNPSVYIIAVLRCSMHTVQVTGPALHVVDAPVRQACPHSLRLSWSSTGGSLHLRPAQLPLRTCTGRSNNSQLSRTQD
jgi:hypothetical protein